MLYSPSLPRTTPTGKGGFTLLPVEDRVLDIDEEDARLAPVDELAGPEANCHLHHKLFTRKSDRQTNRKERNEGIASEKAQKDGQTLSGRTSGCSNALATRG